MADINKRRAEIEGLGASIAALSVDAPGQSAHMQESMGLGFPLLSDVDKEVITAWGLLNPYEQEGIAKPAAFIIGKDRQVLFRALERVTRRVTVDELKAALSGASGSGRLGWSLPSPGNLIHMFRNLFAAGDRKNWMHVILYPLVFVRMLWIRLGRAVGGKGKKGA